MRKNKWCCRALACVFALGLGARLAKAQGCSNWITIDPVYDAATCQLRTVLAHHISYSSCGAPSPGSLWVRIYKDTPSTQGGNTYEDYLLGCFTNGCGSGAGSVNCGVATYKRFDFVLPSSYYQPGTTLYLEEWIGKTNGIQMSYCGLSGAFPATLGSCGSGGVESSRFCFGATPNSTGLAGRLSATGSAVVADNDLTLHATRLPTNQFGYFLNSRAWGFTPLAGGGQGNLCLADDIGRFNRSPQNSGPQGRFQLTIDLNAMPTPSAAVAVLAGETWRFQAWYRDVNPGPTSNFTDAISIVFQ